MRPRTQHLQQEVGEDHLETVDYFGSLFHYSMHAVPIYEKIETALIVTIFN